jgi:aryl-alcohol dehydrogenase-like predicted oxidoreductase
VTSRNEPAASSLGRPTRRNLLKAGTGTVIAAGLAARGQAAQAAPAAVADAPDVTSSTAGRTGGRLPAIGLGPGAVTSLDKRPEKLRAYLRDVLTAYWTAGGRVVDTSWLDGVTGPVFREVAVELGVAADMFVTHQLGSTAGDLSESRVLRQLNTSKSLLHRDQVDVVQVDALAGAEVLVPMLKRWKSAGRVRQVAVSHTEARYFPSIEILMRNTEIDVVQIRYSILNRAAEETILPLAAERGISVLTTMPMESGRLHNLVDGHPVPGWASAFGATTWAQFFLKYVLAHPAVTVVLPSADSAAQVTENMAALRGPVPDDDQRARMVAHMATFAGFAELENWSWDIGKAG